MKSTNHRRTGRPRSVPQVEEKLGCSLEHHVMEQMAAGRTSRQIAGALRIGVRTMKRHLRQRGYRIECDCRLVKVGPCEQGGG